jgi:very-short-patch-repair endonuclease
VREGGIHIMSLEYDSKLIKTAKTLRKNMTKEEKHLWYDFLSKYPIRFQRQKVIGKYIVDFYCAVAKLVIELDGSQHYKEEEITYDEARTKYLELYDLVVVRIPNVEINNNFEGVCRYINSVVKTSLQNQSPSSEGA